MEGFNFIEGRKQ